MTSSIVIVFLVLGVAALSIALVRFHRELRFASRQIDALQRRHNKLEMHVVPPSVVSIAGADQIDLPEERTVDDTELGVTISGGSGASTSSCWPRVPLHEQIAKIESVLWRLAPGEMRGGTVNLKSGSNQ